MPSTTTKVVIAQKDGTVLGEFVLGPGEYVIGSDPSAAIFTDDATVSNQHAKLFVTDTTVELEALDSSLGTIVDGAALRGRIPLSLAEVIRLGNLHLSIKRSGFGEPIHSSLRQDRTAYPDVAEEIDGHGQTPPQHSPPFAKAIRYAVILTFIAIGLIGYNIYKSSLADKGSPSWKRMEWTGKAMLRAGFKREVMVRTLSQGGTVVAWGKNDDGQTTVPNRLNGVVAIAAGEYHTVVLKNDGTVVAWGKSDSGQTSVPDGLKGVVAIAAGASHTLALKSDGTVVAWGAGKTATGERPEYGQSIVPTGLTDVVAIAAGGDHSVALKADGTVTAWGENDKGQANVPKGLSGVMAIAAGSGGHTVALKENGTVVVWGDRQAIAMVPKRLEGVVDIATAYQHLVALKQDGTVVAWGDGDGPQVPAGLSSVVAVSAGWDHTVALKSDGTVVAWGSNSEVPAGLTGVTAITAGNGHTVALKLD
jgi:hypothetical protein